MKKLLLFLALLYLAGCNLSDINIQGNKDYTPFAGWKYSDSADRMSPDTIFNAYLLAKQKIYFKFPFNFDYTPMLNLVYRDSENRFIISLLKPEFKFANKKQSIRIRFDNDEPYDIEAYEQFDNARLLWLDDADTLVGLLKKAKRVLVEATFYDNEKQIMEFDVAGLKWNHIAARSKTTSTKKQEANTQLRRQSNSINDDFDKRFQENLKRLHNAVNVSVNSQSYSINSGYSNAPELQTSQMVDSVNGNVTLYCKYHNKTTGSKSVTLRADFMDGKGNILTTRRLAINCPPNSTFDESIEVDHLGKAYKTYKTSIE